MQDTIKMIIKKLASSSLADNIYVVGSVAQGKENPGDLDIIVILDKDYNSLDDIVKYNALIQIARKYYGWFDPFVKFNNIMFVRNDESTGWKRVNNPRVMMQSFKNDMVPVKQVADKY